MAFKFIFLKLQNCGPCIKFINSGTWDKLKADKALSSKISFEFMEVKPENKQIVGADPYYISRAKETGYPFFYLHKKDNKTIGTLYKQAKTFDQMKSWLLATSSGTSVASVTTPVTVPKNNTGVIKDITKPIQPRVTGVSSSKDKYDAVRLIHQNIMKYGIVPTESKKIPPVNTKSVPVSSASTKITPRSTMPTKVVTRSTMPTKVNPRYITSDSKEDIIEPVSINPVINEERDSKPMVNISSMPVTPKFRPNNFPSSLYQQNIKHGVSNVSRPYHPLYATNPNSVDSSVNEDKSVISFRFKAHRK